MKITFTPLLILLVDFYFCYLSTSPIAAIPDPSFREARFIVHLSHKLAVQPLQSFKVKTPFHCAFKCIEHDQCLSFNMAVSSNGGLKLCQLLTSDVHTNRPRLRPSIEFNFYGIVKLMPVHLRESPSAARNNEWIKLNSNPVHVEARNNKFGTFRANQSGQILRFKLVHISGGMSCWITEPGFEITKFGCGPNLAVFITNTSNQIISPNQSYVTPYANYNLPGVTSNDSQIILPQIDPPLHVTPGQEFRLWYGEDLINSYEDDNVGTLDVDVFVLYK